MKHERGFALVMLLSLLPALIAALAALTLILGVVRTRAHLRNSCRRTLLVGLESAGRDMKALLELNPRAEALRTSIRTTRIARTAATAAGQFELAASLEIELRSLQSEQILLDVQQRELVLSAGRALSTAQSRAEADVDAGGNKIVTARSRSYTPVRPAVHPVGVGPAPNYALDSPFSDSQKLAQHWQSRFELPGPFGKFLRGSGKLEETCAATLETSSGPWRARLAEDKF